MTYDGVVYGQWIERINRFAARVRLGGEELRVHVKNTGRLRELFIPGATVAMEPAKDLRRATRYSVIAVRTSSGWVNVDSQAPHRVAGDALAAGEISEFGAVTDVRREVRYGHSRFDLQYRSSERIGFIEVKGVTLVEDGVAKFPDAPTGRGSKHVSELMAAVRDGYEAAVLFLIQREDARVFAPNVAMDPVFARALQEAAERGVRVLAYRCRVGPDVLELDEPVPVVPLRGVPTTP
ncbi:DNA/RNA nuclease SfsA [Alicyclobacillus macrosporangiidus]|uniref:Sugar fermentation stimulation protein homolog n=1 Tax=Alicyclobacillus macrosporangiidus TaxID=392015 RepID=A0A1I7L6Q0_9BACL|nr:DNA/RNA nuclease SfsA [Alicyclobacillus macrosporangiidus]SFV05429.1 sugar fermentation stimulation protein A [Alicyclobacillus macrosporangiidus]